MILIVKRCSRRMPDSMQDKDKEQATCSISLCGENTYETCESAVLYSRHNNNPVNSKLQLCVALSFAVCIAQLSNKYIQENHNHHGHVNENNQDSQPTIPGKSKQNDAIRREEQGTCKDSFRSYRTFMVSIWDPMTHLGNNLMQPFIKSRRESKKNKN